MISGFLRREDQYRTVCPVLRIYAPRSIVVPQARLDPLVAAEAAKCLGLQGKESRDAAEGLTGGPVVLGVIRGGNARDLAAKVTPNETLPRFGLCPPEFVFSDCFLFVFSCRSDLGEPFWVRTSTSIYTRVEHKSGGQEQLYTYTSYSACSSQRTWSFDDSSIPYTSYHTGDKDSTPTAGMIFRADFVHNNPGAGEGGGHTQRK